MDVDFDFFDSPNQASSSSAKGETGARETPPSHGQHGASSSGSEYSSSGDEYSSDFTDDEIPKNLKKIEAVLPQMTPLEGSDSDSDDDRDDSGRRAPTPDEASSARGDHLSSGSEISKKKSEPTVLKLKPRGMQSKNVSNSDDSYTTDSDVTDVSPLNSPATPHIKHRVDFDDQSPRSSKPPLNPNKSARSRPVSAGSTSSKAPSSRMEQLLNANNDSVDMKLLLEAVMEMEKDEGYDTRSRSSTKSKKPKMFKPLGPAPVPKKNYSFNNDNVRTIDLENQRLMQRILRATTASKKAKAKAARTQKPEPKPVFGASQATTAAVNRRKQQMKIEAENQAMLRRLQASSATKDLQRDKLMRDYSKSMLFGYSIAAAHPDAKRSPYEGVSSPHTRSQSSMSSGRRSRPHSATNRPPSSQASQRQRPHSATVRTGTSSRSASGKHVPTFNPVSGPKDAWDDRW